MATRVAQGIITHRPAERERAERVEHTQRERGACLSLGGHTVGALGGGVGGELRGGLGGELGRALECEWERLKQ